jgi:hypothetical protein
MKRTLIPFALIASLLVGGAALARGKGHPGPRYSGPGKAAHFARMDTNKDGKITRKEAKAAKIKRFKAMDLNKDGAVTRSEAQKARQQRRVDRFKSHDKNKDGRLAKSETWMPDWRFSRLDTNKDGYLTKTEFLAGKRGKPGKAGKRGRRGKGQVFGGLDANNDGKITLKEANAAADRMFQRHDSNKDGVITKDELRKGRWHRHGGPCGKGKGRFPKGKRAGGPKAS